MNPEDIPLRDLHLPEAIGWWPLAPGWWFLLSLVAVGLLFAAWRALAAWQRGRPRRAALAELERLATEHVREDDLTSLAKGLSALLRRTMLAYAPRTDVARLTGDAWLNWLDRGLPRPVFSAGPGQSLGWLPYRKPRSTAESVDATALLDAVKLRLATPLPEETR
ncbi:MAG: DUF4381 domain-containing protein [Woeseia sp.]|nr:DUF4381 domain-containing protein [Woeseia sp.]